MGSEDKKPVTDGKIRSHFPSWSPLEYFPPRRFHFPCSNARPSQRKFFSSPAPWVVRGESPTGRLRGPKVFPGRSTRESSSPPAIDSKGRGLGNPHVVPPRRGPYIVLIDKQKRSVRLPRGPSPLPPLARRNAGCRPLMGGSGRIAETRFSKKIYFEGLVTPAEGNSIEGP